jgi:hypothetical protein
MSKHGLWTIIIEDKTIIKKTGDFSTSNPGAHKIEGHDSFWNDSKWSNIHAIQFTDDGVDNDQVEYKDNSENGSYDASVLGDFRTNFIDKFDAAHLAQLQADWDNNTEGNTIDSDGNPVEETEADKITRLGARPTSYTS